MRYLKIKHFFCPIIVMLLSCKPGPEPPFPSVSEQLKVPVFILEEHHHILAQFHKLIADTSGLATEVSIKLDTLLQHHFAEEEQTVLPFLQLLSDTALRPSFMEAHNEEDLPVRLRQKIKHFGVEHQLINAYITELRTGSKQFRETEIIALDNLIKKHAMAEDQVYFPAAVIALARENCR
jgi:hypothetical protein